MAGSYGGRIDLSQPKSRLAKVCSSFDNSKSNHEKIVLGHYFNHSVEVLLPGSTSIPPGVQSAGASIGEDSCIVVDSLPVSHFIKQEFLNLVQNGYIYALSLGTEIDRDVVVAVLPSGKLLLSVTRDIYEQLGLQGKRSSFDSDRWNVVVNLTDPGFVPGNKTFDRVQYCLTGRLGLSFKFVITWQPLTEADAVLADVLLKLPGSRAVRATELKHAFPAGFRVPSLSGVGGLPDDREFYEWVGSVACRMDATSSGPLSYTSTMVCPEPSVALEHGCKAVRWSGFIAPARILALLQAARESVCSTEGTSMPFVCITVWGFADAPVSWNTQEHGFFNSGDNSYTYVLFPDSHYTLYAAVGPHDTFSL